jgi:membrane-associated protease RseP (regulator of RpoE activity)
VIPSAVHIIVRPSIAAASCHAGRTHFSAASRKKGNLIAFRELITVEGGEITCAGFQKEVIVALSDWKGMKKRVTYVLAFLLLISTASAVSVSALVGAQGPAEEKNVSIKIMGNDEDSPKIIVGDGKNVKVVTEGESCAFIGINMEDLTEKTIEKLGYPKKTGVLVTNIVDDSAAEKFGLMKEDIIYSFGGKKILSSEQLAELVSEKKPGDKVDIVYYREGKKKEIEIELGERTYDVLSMDWTKYEDAVKQYAQAAALAGKNAVLWGRDLHMTKGKLGLVLKDLNEDLASYFDVKPGEGVLVIEVMEGSPSEEAGIKAGDVVVMISGAKVSDVDEFLDEVYQCTGENDVEIELVRKGERKKIALDVGDNFQRFMIMPGERIKRIEISEHPELGVHRDEVFEEVYEKKALEAEIKELKKEIERLEKRLDKIEKE